MKHRLVIHTEACISRHKPYYAAAQKWLDNEVLKDCGPYVPFRTGDMMKSGSTGTVIGSGHVVYNVPYAKANYYGAGRNFSKEKHPQACAQWFEVAKAAKLKSWLAGVNKIANGR